MEKENAESLHIPPLWGFWGMGLVCVVGFLCYIFTADDEGIIFYIESWVGVLGSAFCVILSGRGFTLDADYFSVSWCGFVLERIPWENISQVVLVKRKLRPKANESVFHNRAIYVTVKPASQFPYYAGGMFTYHLRNLFLVWRIYLYSYHYDAQEKPLLEAFEHYFGEVEFIDHR